MATGKHFRTDDAPRQTRRSTPAAPQHTAQPVVPEKKADYEDLYSYEEPRGAKRGTRRPTGASHNAPAKKPAKKASKVPTVIAILCLLAAAGIMFYVLWDLGIISMLLSILK